MKSGSNWIGEALVALMAAVICVANGLAFLVPQLSGVFSSLGNQAPSSAIETGFVTSAFLTEHRWHVLLLSIVFVCSFVAYLRSSWGIQFRNRFRTRRFSTILAAFLIVVVGFMAPPMLMPLLSAADTVK